jgi:pimeloyl-ACP methyl ester carboxylesterase
MPRIAISVGLSLLCAVDDYLWLWRGTAPMLMLSGDKSRVASEQQKILADRLPNGGRALFSGYGHGPRRARFLARGRGDKRIAGTGLQKAAGRMY